MSMTSVAWTDVLSISLLVFTGFMGFKTYVFQVRSNIQSDIEQLDDLFIGTNEGKMKPILHDFQFFRSPTDPTGETSVMIKFYAISSSGADPSRGIRPLWWLDPAEYGNFERKLEALAGIESATVSETSSGIVVNIPSRDPVEIRTVTELAITNVNISAVNHGHVE